METFGAAFDSTFGAVLYGSQKTSITVNSLFLIPGFKKDKDLD
jgi:hypothetical protein